MQPLSIHIDIYVNSVQFTFNIYIQYVDLLQVQVLDKKSIHIHMEEATQAGNHDQQIAEQKLKIKTYK